MSRSCPICGAPNGTCGHTPLALPPITAPGERSSHTVANDDKIYLPQQKVRRGKAGYKGKNVVVIGDDGKPVKGK